MSGENIRSCEYKECYLPDNNNKYWVQFAYLFFSGVYLISDKTEFTFFSLLMFTIPIVLDLASADFPVKPFAVINKIFLGLNAAIGLFCFMGMVGVFVDDGSVFCFSSNSLLLPGKGIEKTLFLIPLTINLFIPVMMYNASPSKSTKWILKQSQELRKAGKK